MGGYELTAAGWAFIAALVGLMWAVAADIPAILAVRLVWWLRGRLPGRAYHQAVARAQHLKEQYLALQPRLAELDPWVRFHGHIKQAAFGLLVSSLAVVLLVVVNWYFSSQVLELFFPGATKYLAAISLTLAQIVFGHSALKARRGTWLFVAYTAAVIVLIVFEGGLSAWRAWILSDLDPGQHALDRLLASIGPAAACVLGMAAPAAIVMCFDAFYTHAVCPFAPWLWLLARARRLATAHGRLRRRYGFLGLMPLAHDLQSNAEACSKKAQELCTAATQAARPAAVRPAVSQAAVAPSSEHYDRTAEAVESYLDDQREHVGKCASPKSWRVPEAPEPRTLQGVVAFLRTACHWLAHTAPETLRGLRAAGESLQKRGEALLTACLEDLGRVPAAPPAPPDPAAVLQRLTAEQQELLPATVSLQADISALDALNQPGADVFALTPDGAVPLPRDPEVAATLADASGKVQAAAKSLKSLTAQLAVLAALPPQPIAEPHAVAADGPTAYVNLQDQLRQALDQLEPAWQAACRAMASERSHLVSQVWLLRLKLIQLRIAAAMAARRDRRKITWPRPITIKEKS